MSLTVALHLLPVWHKDHAMSVAVTYFVYTRKQQCFEP